MNTYSFKRQRGIDDLQNIYAWTGNSQGDNSATNNIEEGLASDGWMTYNFKNIDILDQEAINQESERRKKENTNYIQKLKDSGEFGSEYFINISMKDNPIFDRPLRPTPQLENYKLYFIDNDDTTRNTRNLNEI